MINACSTFDSNWYSNVALLHLCQHICYQLWGFHQHCSEFAMLHIRTRTSIVDIHLSVALILQQFGSCCHGFDIRTTQLNSDIGPWVANKSMQMRGMVDDGMAMVHFSIVFVSILATDDV